VGALAIHVLLRFVRSHSYTPFVVYRVIVGVAVLALVAVGH
jgi:undecaprenyl-diphosphatase